MDNETMNEHLSMIGCYEPTKFGMQEEPLFLHLDNKFYLLLAQNGRIASIQNQALVKNVPGTVLDVQQYNIIACNVVLF